MAKIVLGIATSHSPMLALNADQWRRYAIGDLKHTGLVYPPAGISMTYDEGLAFVSDELRNRDISDEVFEKQVAQCQRGIAELAKTIEEVNPDVTVIISDDQDEWFYEDNMPTFSIFWGDSVPIRPRADGDSERDADVTKSIIDGYGDVAMDIPVQKDLGRHVIDHMIQNDFDVSHFTYIKESYGGKVGRRYMREDGELDLVRESPPKNQGLPHGYAFVVKRLFNNQPRPILPIFENTCYPPNQPTVKRSYKFGEEIRKAIESWDSDLTVAVVASGGMSHFVVDEEMDWMVLDALKAKDAEALQLIPRERLYSAASETQNWIALGGVLQDTDLEMELVEYVPVYRTPAATGGGWGFARWQ
ncbi:MAG: hypothetical protein O2826_06615 [Chloroflexi bacterium]|nr:hypothetical protein [Chloroflexota bacterium]MDA1174175.1 hypothetical protein [Chloroflexota bacterium]